MITFHIITLFPESFSYLKHSIIKRAITKKKINVRLYQLRDFTHDSRKTVDDKPYGGGPGMVLKALPIVRAVKAIIKNKKQLKVIGLSAVGKQFTNMYAHSLARRYKHLVLIAGRYEGIDERVFQILKAEKVSVGPYIVTGGELPAMIMVDAITRQVKGVLGKHESLEESRVASSKVYTRPEIITDRGKTYRVPTVLLSGHHERVEGWRKKQHRQ